MYNYSRNDDTVAALGCFGVIVLAILLILVSPIHWILLRLDNRMDN